MSLNPFKKVPNFERLICALHPGRMQLPLVAPEAMFPGFGETPVVLNRAPTGGWSTPLSDLVPLARICACMKPARILELGSFRGYTALLLAEHSPDESTVVAVDIDPRHGAAYRNSTLKERIKRVVGASSAEIFSSFPDGHFDLVFIDANHSYAAVKNDTELCLRLVSADGVLLWHDYANWGLLSRTNGVPEYLNQLSRRLPIGRVAGTDIAIHKPSWAASRAEEFRQAKRAAEPSATDVWETAEVRG